MRITKKYLLILCIHSSLSYSQDYFNPMFLGDDVASLENLSYITSGGDIPPGDYYLSIYIGDDLLKNVKIGFKKSKSEEKTEACFTKEIIDYIPFDKETKKLFNINVNNYESNKCININEYIENFSYNVELSKLILRLSIPQIYLDSLRSTLSKEDDWDDGIPFFLMNYKFSGSYSKNKGSEDYSSYYLNLNNRINLNAWRFNSDLYFNENKIGSKSSKDVNLNNIYISRNINSIKSNLVLGQSNLGSNLFESLPYIGLTLSTSNEMLPDSDKGYSPSIKGIADNRSKLTIKQNGNIIYQTYVNQGPYDISNLNSVGSSGDYEVELTSIDGTINKYIVPYSSLPNLLRVGKFNYSLTAGKLDLVSAKNNIFSQGTVAFGIPLKATIFAGTQLSDKYKSVAFGMGKDLGDIGALSIDATHSIAEFDDKIQTGESYRALYSKSFSNTGTNLQLTGYRYSTSDYYTLSEASYKIKNNNINYLYDGRRKDSFQINLSQSLNHYGQIYIWGNLNSYWGQKQKTKNIQAGWNKTIKELNNISISASYNKNTFNGSVDDAFYLSLSLPISSEISKNQMYLSNSTSYNKDSYNNSTSIYGHLLNDNLDYNLYQVWNKNSDNNNTNLNINYKANSVRLNAGSTYSSNTKQINYGVSGGVLFHSDGIVFTREAYDTAILVEAKGATGAKLHKSGEHIIINNNGYALIPYAVPYHYNDVEFDPSTFNNNYDIENKILKVSPTRGAISKISFNVRNGYSFLVSVKYKGKPIKFGSLVNNNDDKTISIANDDGTVYLTGVKNKSNYSVDWGDGVSCKFNINYEENVPLNVVNKINVNCL